jgi:hypothetical protein
VPLASRRRQTFAVGRQRRDFEIWRQTEARKPLLVAERCRRLETTTGGFEADIKLQMGRRQGQ